MAHKNNEQNLKPRKNLTSEEAKEMGRRGGIASGKARKAKKNMKEQMKMLLELEMQEGKVKKQIRTEIGINNEELDNQMALVCSLFLKAMSGDTRAFEIIQEMIGQKEEKTEMPSLNINIIDNSKLEEELYKKGGE